MCVEFDGGVVMGADSRTTTGTLFSLFAINIILHHYRIIHCQPCL